MDTIQLYEWQKKFIREFFQKKKMIANVATGAGKTQVAIEIIKKLWEINPNYNILITVPKVVILETLWLPELRKNNITINKVGVYYGYAKEFSKITLTTNASIKKLSLEIFDIIIIDEVHNFYVESLKKILRHKFEYMLGLTASIYNAEQKHWGLLEKFDYNIFKYNTKDAIHDGLINTFNLTDIQIIIDEPEIREKYNTLQNNIKNMLGKMGGFDNYLRLPADNRDKLLLQKLFNDRNELILNYPKKLDVAADIIDKHRHEKILVFNQYNKISTKITWHLIDKEIKSHIIDSHVKREDRVNLIKKYEDGKFNVLLTSRIFDEGYNLPGIGVVIILSGSSTERQMIQRIGRVLRKKDKPSEIYQIYVKDTFEETHSNERSEYFRDLALEYKIEVI